MSQRPTPNSQLTPMQATIHGTTMQTVHVDLQPGESVYCQTHAMAWMTDDVRMDTNTGGGLLAGLKRSVAGGSFFMTTYTAAGRGTSRVVFASRFPGHVLPFTLAAGESLLCRKETFLVAQTGVTFAIAFQQRLGAGLLGGEGFVLQRITGPGTVWLDLSGETCIEELQPGRKLLVHAGHVGIVTPGVDFSIQRVGGVRNMLFGGEGIFLASLAGPGKAWLQSMPIMNLAESIAHYLPSGQGGRRGRRRRGRRRGAERPAQEVSRPRDAPCAAARRGPPDGAAGFGRLQRRLEPTGRLTRAGSVRLRPRRCRRTSTTRPPAGGPARRRPSRPPTRRTGIRRGRWPAW